jgi:Flp pilus assembly protein TadG
VKIKKRTTTDEGQAVVEFAVILPVLLLLLFAILQFGVLFNNYIQVTAAAREGARKAATSRTLGVAGAESAATAAAQGAAPGLTTSSMGITYPNNPTFIQGSDVKVQVTYPYSISIIGLVVSSGNLTASTTMRVE